MTDFSKAKGNKTLQRVADKSALMKAGAVVKQLPIKELKDNPDNEYLFGMEQSDIEHTTVGIKRNGFKGAINVYSCTDGTYEVYSGHIRKYAAIEAGLETIPCLVEPEPEETIKRRQLLGANLYGRNKIQSDNPILIARQIHYHRETLEMEGFKGDTREQIAADFRISDSQVYKYETLLKLEPELQELAADRKAPWSILYTAKSFSKEEQEKLAVMILEASETAKEPITKREVKDFMNSILSKKPVNGQLSIEDYERVHGEQEGCYSDDATEDIHGNQREEFSVDENIVKSEVDEKELPSVDSVCKVYKHIGDEIRNYYELKNHLINMHGKRYESYMEPNGIRYRCSPKGICIDNCDEITWVKFIDILSEIVIISKDNGSEKDGTDNENCKSKDNVGIEPVVSELKVSEIEQKIYKLEAEMSSGTTEQIFWSNQEEAKRIMQSLIALLEDEIEAIN